MWNIWRPRGRKRYRIRYKDATGQYRIVPGFNDREATKHKARELERQAERQAAGMIQPQEAAINRPIAQLITEYIQALTTSGRAACHTKEQRRLLTTATTATNVTALRNIQATKVRAWIATLNYSPRTKNAYRDALISFLNWCKRQPYITENPLAQLEKAKHPGGRRHKPRRAYTTEELQALTAAAPPRTNVYMLAALSGLRHEELRQLEKRDLTPTGKHPSWHLRPEITKGKRLDNILMLPEAAKLIIPTWSKLTNPTARLFPTVPRIRTLNKDLGRAKITKLDTQGRTLDFHSLRYTFCTHIARHLPIQLVRILMRHKDIRTTFNLYADLGLKDIAEKLPQIPNLFNAPARAHKEPN